MAALAEAEWWWQVLSPSSTFEAAEQAVLDAGARGAPPGLAAQWLADIATARAAGDDEWAADTFNVARAWSPEGQPPAEGSAQSRPDGTLAGTGAGLADAAGRTVGAAASALAEVAKAVPAWGWAFAVVVVVLAAAKVLR